MSPPVLKSQSPIAVSFGSTLTVQTPSAAPGDLVLLWVDGVSWFSLSEGWAGPPPGFNVLHRYSDSTSLKMLAWAKVPQGGLSQVQLQAAPGQDSSGGWKGEAAVFGNVAFRQPGWIEVPGSAGDYAQTVRSDVAAFTTIQVFARVDFDVLGVANNWFYGWSNGDLGFGLDASNRPIFYVNNTLGNPIGNVAANADIPGLTTNRKVWLHATLDTTTGNVSYQYSFDELDEWGAIFWHWTNLGTTVAGTNGGTTPRLTNSDTVFYGARDAATTPFNGQVFSVDEWCDLTLTNSINFTDDLPGGTTLVGGDVIHYQPTGEDFASYPFDDWNDCDAFCYFDPDNISIPERRAYGPDRLAYHVFRASKFGGPHIDQPIDGPADWTAQNDRSTNALGLYVKHISRTKEISAPTGAAPVSADPGYSYVYYAVVIRGRTDLPALPASPQPPNLHLGCADSYTAFFTAGDYETIIDEAKWSKLNWGRILDDISKAGGTFPDDLGGTNCLAAHGGLLPWKHGLLIERNDQEVWRGPITRVRRQGDSIVVDASDVLSRYQRRFAIRDALATYTQADCGTVFYDVLTTHASLPQDQWSLPVPLVNTNVPIDRVLMPKGLKYAWDLLSELLGTALDAFIANGRLFLFEPGVGWVYQAQIKRTLPGSYNVNNDLIYGMFTEQSWSVRPDWSIDGMSQGNFIAAPSADSGEYGFRTFATSEVPASIDDFGVLDYVDVDPLEVPADQPPSQTASALQARSDSLAALRAYAPAVIEGGALSQDAPIDINNLIPGSIWLLDIFDAGYGQLLVASRLKRVEVTVSKNGDGTISETIVPVLEPPGWEGAMNA